MDCVICKRKLKGFQTKFCSDTCRIFNKTEVVRKLRLKRKTKFPPKYCILCKKSFSPIRVAHVFCSIKCRDTANVISRKEARHARGLRPAVSPMDLIKSTIPKNLEKHSSPIFRPHCSDNKNQILEFLENGGEITKFPSVPAGKTPDVNTAYVWIGDENLRSTLLYEMGDEE
jgi:predicted nucleic acid-binding Zn ribbon protein